AERKGASNRPALAAYAKLDGHAPHPPSGLQAPSRCPLRGALSHVVHCSLSPQAGRGKAAATCDCRAHGGGKTTSTLLLVEPAGRMGQHGVDLPGVRGEICTRYHLLTVVLPDFAEKSFELPDIPIDGLPELAIGFVALAHLVERLSALHGIEPPCKHVALAAIVALPEIRCGFVIDHAGDIDRQRVKRFDPMPDTAIFQAQGALFLRGGRGG